MNKKFLISFMAILIMMLCFSFAFADLVIVDSSSNHTHTYGSDLRCTVCGALAEGHTGEGTHGTPDVWTFDSETHYKKCINPNCSVITSRSVHSYDNTGKCKICNYVMKDFDKQSSEDTETEEKQSSSTSKEQKEQSSSTSKEQKEQKEVTTITSVSGLIIENWMRNSKDLNKLAISLRCDSKSYDKANRNIYSLNEAVSYYVDIKNGSTMDITNKITIVLQLPLSFDAVDVSSGKVDKNKNTITWTYNGLTSGSNDTKVATVKYKSLSGNNKSQVVYPKATMTVANQANLQDVSTIIHLLFKSESTTITDQHQPYMLGDAEGNTFRPDDTISRAEGAIVLARVFGINYSGTYVAGDEFTDIGTTYKAAQQAIIACSMRGLINGFNDGSYRPNDKMTNAQFMKIIACNIELKAQEENIPGLEIKTSEELIKEYKDPTAVYMVGSQFTDKHWAITYITLLTRLNMTPTSDDNKDLHLDTHITRAEVARLINLYLLRAPQASGTSSFVDVPKDHPLLGDILEASLPAHTYKLTKEGKEIVVKQ